jgi:SAM-dependent methyltransferase
MSQKIADCLTHACPLCERNESFPFLQKQNLSLVQCKNCSMIFANPVPAEMISGSFYNETHAPFYLSPDKLESDYASVRFERELRLFRRFCKSGNVLDVGCSTGAFLFQLQKRFPGNYETLGTDVSQPALEYAKSRGILLIQNNFCRKRRRF